MKKLVLLFALVLGVTEAMAQDFIETEGDDAVVVEDNLPPKKRQVLRYDDESDQVVEAVPVAPAPKQVNRNPIYILNNQRFQGNQGTVQAQKAVQEQPVTVVEASPLKESRAEKMRRSRQNMEAQTEQKIVEKLEEARMEDEQARADRLFGNGFSGPKQVAPAATTAAEAYPPVQVVTPPVQVVPAVRATPIALTEEEKAVEKDVRAVDTREEMKAAFRDLKAEETVTDPTTYYVGAQVGLGEYPDVVNVRGNIASGFNLGVVTPERIVVEGSFVYSNYEVEQVAGYGLFKDLDQYNFGAAIKYQLLPGRIRPVVGALASYTYRKLADQNQYSFGYNTTEEITSNAFDIGFVGGIDVMLTKSFALGADFRYLTNLAYRTDTKNRTSFVNPQLGTPIEELDYYVFTLGGKFTF